MYITQQNKHFLPEKIHQIKNDANNPVDPPIIFHICGIATQAYHLKIIPEQFIGPFTYKGVD